MSLLKILFQNGINSVKPHSLINNIKSEQLEHKIGNKKVYIVGFGKAALGFLKPLYNRIKDRLIRSIFSIPEPTNEEIKNYPELFKVPEVLKSKTQVFYGSRLNITNDKVVNASKEIFNLITTLKAEDCLILTITGGGSALLCYPEEKISHFDIIELTNSLSKAGASINELNCIRSKLDKFKGGGILKYTNCNTILSLLLSDVIEDDVTVIASGPSVIPGQEYYICSRVDNDVILQSRKVPSSDSINSNEVIKKYNLEQSLSPAVKEILNSTIKNYPDISNKSINNFVVGNNQIALATICQSALSNKYKPIILTHSLAGDGVEIIGQLYKLIAAIYKTDIKSIDAICRNLNIDSNIIDHLLLLLKKPSNQKLCLLLGGETPITIPKNQSSGKGGRCSHMALELINQMLTNKINFPGLSILFGATDGLDGNTNSSGIALTTDTILSDIHQHSLNPIGYLTEFNSFNFWVDLDRCSGRDPTIVYTGLTGTNVMDIIIIYIDLDLICKI